MKHLRNRGPLGDLPYPLSKERQGGEEIDPGAGLIPDWVNNYTASIFPFTLANANQSQQIIPANPMRTYVLIQNKDPAADMFVNFGNNATAYVGVIIIPLGNYEFIGGANGGPFCPSDSINVMSLTAGIDGVVVEGVMPPVIPGM